ncbi:hypothetical protein H70357_26400 [Paenibacillus sp. FSL H7-0357]|uniref:hypothetical protein n=1 Tax=Paenibacillus sp. FSL H7-0357 TaxID=1536774 RepID=UPI0004F6FD1C|nr:hypothetical protein [Paenibacillus sp. FSL H7-0357]AIQ19846.1 hypothetical protein H70357_26400 [Paenibacillus sp. FSL H7-0357]
MQRLMTDVIANKFYNLDFEILKTCFSPLQMIKYAHGYVIRAEDFIIFLGENGGIKVGIEYENKSELLKNSN